MPIFSWLHFLFNFFILDKLYYKKLQIKNSKSFSKFSSEMSPWWPFLTSLAVRWYWDASVSPRVNGYMSEWRGRLEGVLLVTAEQPMWDYFPYHYLPHIVSLLYNNQNKNQHFYHFLWARSHTRHFAERIPFSSHSLYLQHFHLSFVSKWNNLGEAEQVTQVLSECPVA